MASVRSVRYIHDDQGRGSDRVRVRDGDRNRNRNKNENRNKIRNKNIIKNDVIGPHTRYQKNYKEKFSTEHGSLDTVGKSILLGVSVFRG